MMLYIKQVLKRCMITLLKKIEMEKQNLYSRSSPDSI